MTHDPLLVPLGNLLNRQIERSSPAREATAALDGRTLAIRLRNTALSIYMSVADGGLSLTREYTDDPDAILETTPLGLAQLARGELTSGRASVSGDPVVARDFEQLLQSTRPDWEEELSHIVGDVAAYQIGNAVRNLFDFGRRATDSFTRDTAEYFQEERRDLPAPAEIEKFNREVTELAGKVDAIGKHIEQLAARLKQ